MAEVVEFRIVEAELPNGDPYGIFYVGRHEIGRAMRMVDGWVPFGKRKTLPRIHAAKAMIDSLISKAEQDRAHAIDLLRDLRFCNGGTLPPSR